MTERLPNAGEATWQNVLGAADGAGGFLRVAHNDDGTLKSAAITSGLTYTPVNLAGDTMTGLLVSGTGDNQQGYASQGVTTATQLKLYKGTSASPDTALVPNVRAVRTMANTSGTVGDGVEQLSVIEGIAYGTAAMTTQGVGVYGASVNQGTTGTPDACGVYGLGRVIGSGTGSGIGGFFNGRKDSTVGKACGIEVSSDNETGVNDTYTSSAFNASKGIWLHATGTGRSSVGLEIGNPFNAQFVTGIGILSQGTGGPILTHSFRDDSQSATSIQINGTHATAAIATAAGAGQLLVGGTTSIFGVSNNLVEIQGSNNNVDGLLVMGSVANQRDYHLRVRNSAGTLTVAIIGTAGNGLTGTAVGDAIIAPVTSTKQLHLGGSTKVVTVTNNNQFALWGVTPVSRPSAYTPTNVTTDRSFDANSTTIDELADVLGTLIADIQSWGGVG